MNRRVVFRIWRWGAPVPREINGPNPTSVLPMRLTDGAAASSPLLACRPWRKGEEEPIPCVLPMKPAVLQQGSVLENAKGAKGMLPESEAQGLPRTGVLPAGAETQERPAQ